MIPIAKPYIGSKETEAVVSALESGNLAQGQLVEQFENEFADYCGVKHAIAVGNGTEALCLALLGAGIGEGDEVITTPFSFIATANAIKFCGAKPVFCDIDEKTFNINPDQIEAKITDKTKAILPVHLFGQPCDMSRINTIAERSNLCVIEDACQAHGATYKGDKVGSLGMAGCFSFYPTKNMTCGEGGMITTDDKCVNEISRLLRNHGQTKRYHHPYIGYNFRMTDINAAIGIEQLKRLDSFNLKRKANAKYLCENIYKCSTDVTAPYIEDDHVFNQFTVKVKNRDQVAERLNNAGIGTGIYYPIPINHQPVYFSPDTPVSSGIAQKVLSLPVHPQVEEADLNHIINTL